ncbi:MAG: hypothetical protein K2P69_15305, partial [Eubacterium sp.]|nr:hypothetical protein [Eubacterium sp.]
QKTNKGISNFRYHIYNKITHSNFPQSQFFLLLPSVPQNLFSFFPPLPSIGFHKYSKPVLPSSCCFH